MLFGTYMVLAIVVLFGVTIFVHELGHFIAARLCGMVIDRFSIGFGPAIWKKKRGDIEFMIGCIPVGGYVSLPQLDPAAMERVQGKKDGTPAAGDAKAAEAPRVLPRVAPWKKIVVSVSGAAGNVLFAVVLAWVVYLGGRSGGSQGVPLIGYVETNSVAYAEGLRPGDEIVSVNGDKIGSWYDYLEICALSERVTLKVKGAEGESRDVALPTTNGSYDVRMVDGVEQGAVCTVVGVEPGSMADKAGIKPGDVVSNFDGVRVGGFGHLVSLVQQRLNQKTPLTVDRKGQAVNLSVTPFMDSKYDRVIIGVQFNPAASFQAMGLGLTPSAQIRSDAGQIFRILRALVTPRQAGKAAGSLGGPVSILGAFWRYVQAGLMMALGFTRFLNVNLAILNLLPIPVLDGGHVLFSLWEAITRRPVRAKVADFLVNVFASLLIAAMVVLTYRDVFRWIRFRAEWRRESTETNAVPAQANVQTNAPAPEGK